MAIPLAMVLVLRPPDAGAQDSSAAIWVLPAKKLFPVPPADALGHGFSLSRVTDNSEWAGSIGGVVPLAETDLPDMAFQVSVGASAFSRLIKTPGHITVVTVDYKVDIPLDIQWTEYTFRLGFGHMSSHFADDGIEQLGNSSISSVRDYLTFGAVRDLAMLGGYIYALTDYTFHNEPTGADFIVQFGGELGNVRLFDAAKLYGAFDIKLKEEVSWGTTQSYQAGVRVFQQGDRAVRLSYTLRSGFEERGQFFDTKVTNHLISLALEL